MELRKQQVASWSVDIPEEEEQGQRQRRQGSQDSPLQLMDLSDETDGEGSGLSRSQSPSQSQSPTLSGSQTPVGRPPPYFGDLSSSSGGESTPPSPLLNHRVAGMIRSEFSKSAGALCDQLRGGDSSNRGGSSGAGTGTSEKAKPTMVRKMRSHAWQNAGFRIDDDASEGYGDIDDSSASVHVPIEPRSLADLMNGKKNAFEREESAVPFVREKFEKFGAKANVDTTAARRGGGVGGDGEPTPLASGGQWEQKVSKTDAQPLARSVSRSDTEPAASFEQGKQASIFHSPPPAFQSDAEIVGVDSDATIPARGGRKKQISKHNHRKGDPKQTRCKARCCPKRPSVTNPTRACFTSLLPLLGYLLFGAVFYFFVEGPYELEHAGRWEAHFNATMAEATALLRSGNITQTDFDAIEKAINTTVAATKQNKIPQPLDDMNWDLGSGKAFFFVVTVVTTIGYGTIAPTTALGKLITMFLASVGIATFGYTITLVTERLLSTTRAALERLSAPHDSCCCPRGLPKCQPSAKVMLVTVAIMNVVIVMCAGLIGVFGYPAWGWGNAVYWAVITFTTVGLGDFYPYFAVDRSPAYKWLGYFGFFLVLTLGIALLSALLSALISVFSHQLGGIVGHHKYGAGGMQGMDRHHKIIVSPPSPSKHRKKPKIARRSSTTKAVSPNSTRKILPQSSLARTRSHR